jgi:hypothetical protein
LFALLSKADFGWRRIKKPMELRISPNYRKVAEECLDMAQRTADRAERENLQRIAEVWLTLATYELTGASREFEQVKSRAGLVALR